MYSARRTDAEGLQLAAGQLRDAQDGADPQTWPRDGKGQGKWLSYKLNLMGETRSQ